MVLVTKFPGATCKFYVLHPEKKVKKKKCCLDHD